MIEWVLGGVVMRLAYVAAIGALALGGCAYKADPLAAPSYNVVTSYSEKLPGKWLLAVESTNLNQTIKPSGYACSAHNFPLELNEAFKISVSQTLKNIFEEVEVLPTPVPGDQVKRRGAQGMVVVRGEEVRGRLDVQPGFWQANMKTEILIVAATYIDGPAGRIFGTTVEGQGISDSEAGLMCSGGSKSFENASTIAMRDVVRKIAEAIGNSERVRANSRSGKKR